MSLVGGAGASLAFLLHALAWIFAARASGRERERGLSIARADLYARDKSASEEWRIE